MQEISSMIRTFVISLFLRMICKCFYIHIHITCLVVVCVDLFLSFSCSFRPSRPCFINATRSDENVYRKKIVRFFCVAVDGYISANNKKS